MTTFTAALTGACLATSCLLSGVASAQTGPDDRGDAFDGVKIGASVDNRRHEVKRAAPTLSERIDDRSGGIGYRAFAGYDKTIGGIGLIGVEAGVGNGGKDARQAVTAGTYRLDPGWAWDASARFGLLPTANVLLYGRVGYGWTRANEQVAFSAAGRTPFRRKTTEGGFMYGFGAEIAVAKSFAIRTEFDQTDFGKGFKAARLQLGGVVRF